MRSAGGIPDVTGLDLIEAEAILTTAGFRVEKKVTGPPAGRIRSNEIGESRASRGVLRVARQRTSGDGVIEVTCVWQTASLE